MKKNKLILFDWGNIVEVVNITEGKYSCRQAFQDLFKACGYDGDKNIFNSLASYKISSIPTIEEFEKAFNKMKVEYSFNVDFKKFVELYDYYFDKIDYYKDVKDYEVSLKDKCYIGIFSNLTIFDKKRLDKEVGLNNYDYVFLSFEFNERKPNIGIYKEVYEKIPFDGKDILFIDDREDNIETAKSMGWNTFRTTGLELEKIKKVCNKFIEGNKNREEIMKRKITYVTGNWAKLDSARKALEPLGYIVDNVKMETPEIQADDVTEVAKYSAKWACKELGKAVLKNDTGLFVKSLNGFPGVYTHYVDDTIGEDGLLKLMKGIDDREAYFKEVLAYCEPGKEPVVFEGITKGTIAKRKSGTYGWSWDFVFVPDGQKKTLGCYPDDERWKFWSLDSYRKLAKYLKTK